MKWVLIFVLFSSSILGQEFLEQQADMGELESVSELLNEPQLSKPICLTKSFFSKKEIQNLPFLSSIQQYYLWRFLNEQKPFFTHLELLESEGIAVKDYPLLLAHFTFDCSSKRNRRWKGKVETFYLQTFPEKAGFTADNEKLQFEGLNFKQINRIKLSPSPQLALDIATENDIGEKWGTHIGGNLMFNKNNHQLLIGNYTLMQGFGMAHAQGFKTRMDGDLKPYFVSSWYRKASPINEFNYNSGSLYHYQNQRHQLGVYASFRKPDATLYEDTITSEVYFKSVDFSGLSRNQSEKKNNKSLFKQNYGLVYGFETTHTEWLFSFDHLRINHSFQPNGIRQKSTFNLVSSQKLTPKVWHQLETVISSDDYIGAHSFWHWLIQDTELNLGARYWKNLNFPFRPNPYGQTFDDQEWGIFLRYFQYDLLGNEWTSYLDIYRFGNDFNSRGIKAQSRYRIRLEHQILTLGLIYQFREKIEPFRLETNPLIRFKKWQLMIHHRYRWQDNWQLTQILRFQKLPENENPKSYAINLNLSYDSKNYGKWKIGFSRHRISEWENRIYTFEPSLPYRQNLSLLYDKGNRWYVMGDFKWFDWNLKLKYAHHQFENRAFLSSGVNQLEGNLISEFNLWLAYKI